MTETGGDGWINLFPWATTMPIALSPPQDPNLILALALSSGAALIVTLVLATFIVLPPGFCSLDACLWRGLRRRLGEAGSFLLDEINGEEILEYEEFEPQPMSPFIAESDPGSQPQGGASTTDRDEQHALSGDSDDTALMLQLFGKKAD